MDLDGLLKLYYELKSDFEEFKDAVSLEAFSSSHKMRALEKRLESLEPKDKKDK